MPNEFGRNRRVAEQIKRELAPLVRELTLDRGLGVVTITDVEVSPDLHHATLFISCLNAGGEKAAEALKQASGFLRSQLSRKMRIRKAPDLSIQYDESVAHGARISALLSSVEK
jgi:ribosome-binding factor A